MFCNKCKRLLSLSPTIHLGNFAMFAGATSVTSLVWENRHAWHLLLGML